MSQRAKMTKRMPILLALPLSAVLPQIDPVTITSSSCCGRHNRISSSMKGFQMVWRYSGGRHFPLLPSHISDHASCS
jgi:hypothetical protein